MCDFEEQVVINVVKVSETKISYFLLGMIRVAFEFGPLQPLVRSLTLSGPSGR